MAVLASLFLFSGASGLIFDTVFVRLLTHTFGNTAPLIMWFLRGWRRIIAFLSIVGFVLVAPILLLEWRYFREI